MRTSLRLEDNLDAMRRLHIDEWVEIVTEMKPMIEELMRRAKTTNPIEAVVPVVKKMHEDDKSPLLVLAVATEMVIRGHNPAPISASDAATTSQTEHEEERV